MIEYNFHMPGLSIRKPVWRKGKSPCKLHPGDLVEVGGASYTVSGLGGRGVWLYKQSIPIKVELEAVGK